MEAQADQSTFENYLKLWSGQLISLLGSSIASFAIIWWITLETGSALYLSAAALLSFAPLIILGPFSGVFVDRWNRKALIGVVDFLQALTTVFMISLFLLDMASVWYILALVGVRGVFQAFHSPAVSAIIPLMVPREKLSRINGVSYLLTGAVTLVGPVLGALLLEYWRISDILWIDAITFIVAVIPLLMISIPSVRMEQGLRPAAPSFRDDFSEGLGFIRRARGFLTFALVATSLNFLLTPLSTILPYYVKVDHLGDASSLALVSAFFQGGILAGGVLMSVMKGFKRKTVAITVSIYGIFVGYTFFALAPTGWFWVMATSGLAMGFCVPIANVSTQTIIQTIVPPNLLGRVNSVLGSLASAASPLGMILSGAVVEFAGTASLLLLGCSMSGMVVMTVSWIFTDFRNLEEAGAESPNCGTSDTNMTWAT